MVERHNLDGGASEVAAFGENRFIAELGECVDATVAEVESSRVTPFAVFSPSSLCRFSLNFIKGYNFYTSALEKELEVFHQN